MFELNDWISEPRFYKTYSNRGLASVTTRSVARLGMARQNIFSAFVWKI